MYLLRNFEKYNSDFTGCILLPRILYRDKHIMSRHKNLNGRSEDGNIPYNFSASSGCLCLPLSRRDGERRIVIYNYRLGKKEECLCVHPGSLNVTRFLKITEISENV